MINKILAVLSGRNAEPKVDNDKDHSIIPTDPRVSARAYMRNNPDRDYYGLVNEVDLHLGTVELEMSDGSRHQFPVTEVEFLERFQPHRVEN